MPTEQLPLITQTEESATQEIDLFDKAWLLDIERTKFGNRRKVTAAKLESTVTVDADKALLSMSKKLLQSPEYTALTKLDSDITAYLNARCLPSPFRAGLRFLPIPLVESTHAALKLFSAGRDKAADAFMWAYDAHVEEASTELRDLYDASNYPSKEAARAAFTMKWSFRQISTPKGMKSIAPAVFEEQAEAVRQQCEEAIQDIRAALRVGMSGLVEHMLDRLQPDEEGKTKTFRDKSLTPKFNTFLETFDIRNITNDESLAKLAAQAREMLAGVSADQIRESDNLRERLVKGMVEIKAELDTMLQDRPVRKFKTADTAEVTE
jgi:ElaB/YqjD/DUF883 family membrane-anchored ribosome-binding protein